MKANAREIRAALLVAQSGRTPLGINKTLQRFALDGIGRVEGKQYIASVKDRERIKQWLASQGIDWRSAPETLFEGTREDVSGRGINEKNARLQTGANRVLVRPVGPGVVLNGAPLPLIPATDAFYSIGLSAIHTLEAQAILLVENSRAFHRICDYAFKTDVQGWLAVYRGDPANPNGHPMALSLCQAYGITLIAFCDYDPAGIRIGLDCQAEQCLLPDLDSLSRLAGSAEDFQTQHEQWISVRKKLGADGSLRPWLAFLNRARAGYTQERMLSHGVPLKLVSTRLMKGTTDDPE